MISDPQVKRKQVLSAIQPTGNLHLGRYFGAIRNWVDLQEKYDCIYGVVNYHAITMPFDPLKLKDQVWELVYDLLAVGIKPENIFIQSMVPEHTELAWIFNCVSSYGELQRMTQFKDKSQQINDKDKDAFISTGLFTYPVLQAADILIYRADYVPVGKDQEQHLELSRNIAQRFNQIVGQEYFQLPEPLYTEIPKVMSTADPLKKMSASLGPKHHINVFSEPDVIRKQIKSAVTDSEPLQIRKDEFFRALLNNIDRTNYDQFSAGVANLFRILDAAGGREEGRKLLIAACEDKMNFGPFKEVLSEQIIKMTEPFRANRATIVENKSEYQDMIAASSKRIRQQAQETIKDVKELIGLINT